VLLPLYAHWERTPYLKHLEYLEKSQYFDPEQIKDIQWKKLKAMLAHAYENCSFYRDKYVKEGVHPKDVRSMEDFRRLPVLNKTDVHKYKDRLIARKADRYYHFLTSGSTGKPLEGYWNKECSQFKRACALRSSLWSGYKLGERIYCLYGNPEKELKGFRKLKSTIRRKFMNRIEILDLLQLSEDSMLKFALKMQRKPPSLLWGHTHGLYTLSKFIEKTEINGIKPKGIYSAGMVLHDWERKKVEEVFHCKFQNRYGCEELGLIAAECKRQEGLHINTDSHYVEVLDKHGVPVHSGGRGQITITDLHNMAMPFIRYQLEDIVIPTNKTCSCGRTQPLIEKIEGRVADFLITPENKLVSGISLTDHFAGHIPGIIQIQLIQEKIDLLSIKIVKDANFDKNSINQIADLVRDFFGNKMKYECQYVDDIPKGPTGKFRFTICKVKNELI
jgi:phenylacetate-CoA ligase